MGQNYVREIRHAELKDRGRIAQGWAVINSRGRTVINNRGRTVMK